MLIWLKVRNLCEKNNSISNWLDQIHLSIRELILRLKNTFESGNKSKAHRESINDNWTEFNKCLAYASKK